MFQRVYENDFFFFDIIHASDETFTKADTEKFLKRFLKIHKRSDSNQRVSAPKVRLVKKKATANCFPIDVPIANGERSDADILD